MALPASGVVRRKAGAMAGRISIAEDFDTWPDDVATALGIDG